MVGVVDKNVSLFIKQQFPAVYQESGAELIALTEEYYKWLESTTNQSIYVSRRFFEYRDIATTLDSMLVYFKNKYMADLPYNEATIKILVRNILDLYRRKGTPEGIEVFFRMFYNKDVEISYPASQMMKISDSKWKTGNYLQLFPNNNTFISASGKKYNYETLLSRNIRGSFSDAKAAVDKINTILLNGEFVPIIYIDDVKGSFEKYDELITVVDGEQIGFGFVDGSMNEIEIDLDFFGTVGNEIGDLYEVRSISGVGGAAVATQISEEFDGQIKYSLRDGGWGYTIENTRLLSSNQLILLTNPDKIFNNYERLTDAAGTSGIVTGQTESLVAVRIDTGTTFSAASAISTVDRAANFQLAPVGFSTYNASGPGDLFPDTDDPLDVKVDALTNIETVNLIADVITPYVAVTLNASDYGLVDPMSGTASPVNLSTPLNQAFDLTEFNIGTIVDFANVDPGTGYVNDVFSLVQDRVFAGFGRRDQNIILDEPTEVFDFKVGEIITEVSTGKTGIVREVNAAGYLVITPYTYYGFQSSVYNILRGGQVEYATVSSETNYTTELLGQNAEVASPVSFEIGTVEKVSVFSSGFGYPNGIRVELIDTSGNVAAEGVVTATTQGTNSGYWSSFNSHLNGYQESELGALSYYDSKQRVQDSDYFQEYSYELKSMVNPKDYIPALKESVHLAGTKVFNQFLFKTKAGITLSHRFIRFFNDDGVGSILDTQPLDEITTDILNFTVDSDELTSDNVPS